MQHSKNAQDLLSLVQRRASNHGHTGLALTPAELQQAVYQCAKTSMNKWTPAQLAAFKRQVSGYLVRTPAAGQPWLFKIHGPDVDIVAEERLVLDAFTSTALNMRFIDVAPDMIQRDLDIDIVADEILYHMASNETLCVITAKETDTKARRDALFHAITCRQSERHATMPLFMSIHRMLAQAQPGALQRSVIVVDNAHLFGSLEWAKLVRMTTKTTVLIGCSFLEGRAAGITLRRLFPMSAGAYAYNTQRLESRFWLTNYLTTTLLAHAEALLTRVVDLGQMRTLAAPQRDIMVVCKTDTVSRHTDRSAVRLLPLLLRDIFTSTMTRDPVMAVDAAALKAFTVGDWVHFLAYLRRPCLLLKFDTQQPDPDVHELILTAPSFSPRTLAYDLSLV